MNHSTLSNRSINKALRASGLTCTKVKNGRVTYATKGGAKVTVMAPETHEKNTASTFKEICDLLNMTIEEFAIYARTCEAPGRTKPTVANNVGERLKAAFTEKQEVAFAEDYARAAAKAQAAQERLDATETQTPAPRDPEPGPAPRPVAHAKPAKPKKMQGPPGTLAKRKDQTVEYVRRKGRADIHELSAELGIKTNYVSTICGMLIQSGRLRRVGTGVFEVPTDTKEATVQKEAADTKKATVQKKTVLRTSAKGREETVWEVLDLLFPDGFKARHMPAVEQWKKITLDLMKEVEGG